MKKVICILVLLCCTMALYPVDTGMLGSEWTTLEYEQKVMWLRGVATGCGLMQDILLHIRIMSAPLAMYIFVEVVDWYIEYIDAGLENMPELLDYDVASAIFWDEVGGPGGGVE